jgi:3D (Asp-Asp-Asp) domain-containing protein
LPVKTFFIRADTAAAALQDPMLSGLVAALALSASPAPAQETPPSTAPGPAQTQAPDTIGDMIQAVRGAVDDTVNAVTTFGAELKATLYHGGSRGVGARDSLGCRLAPMRTVAVDPRVFPRHSVLFIKETVGLRLPDGSVHDGYWYASDVGGAIKGQRIDLFTGVGAASMKALAALNLTTISAVKVGIFKGCPSTSTPTLVASN